MLITCLLTGTMDALAAIFILSHGDAAGLFKGIASGIYGQRALAGGFDMIMTGVFIHYFIASCFTVFYFFIYPKFPVLKKTGWSIVIYGIFVWAVMKIVVYLTMNIWSFSPAGAVKNCLILMVTIGLPCTLMMRKLNGINQPDKAGIAGFSQKKMV